MVCLYGQKNWYCSGKCKTIQKPYGKVVVENLFLYGLTVWSQIFDSSGKCKTIWKPYENVVVENSFPYGFCCILVWNIKYQGS
ncbi:hypothetical protein [Eubacterium ventriosum]|uniref:Uncharacterized protein n=1 Tax=Eubacterium ventriosum TaxID=39496 RepID=A0A415LH81_9FIRM|nr:hypothetical protein DW018_00315 [Eubacterium ventriosum]